MDETPIKAGHKGKGKMKTGYFWPVYGDKDEAIDRQVQCVPSSGLVWSVFLMSSAI